MGRVGVLSLFLSTALVAHPGEAQEPLGETTVLRASRIFDGLGAVLENRDVVIRDGRIVELVPLGEAEGDVVYDLTSHTLLPGYIDTHVHIGSYFRPDGTIHLPEAAGTPGQVSVYAAENAYRTVMSGVTTVQSIGAPDDADLKEWIERGIVPGPRVLSSLGMVRDATGSPEEIRSFVREKARAGADLVKVFASSSIRFGGVTTLSLEQLEAACGEARALGLRSVVHAYLPDAVELAVRAGCTQIEHGWLLDESSVRRMAGADMYFGTQIGLLFRNYAEYRDRFIAAGYAAEGLEQLLDTKPKALRVFKEAVNTPGLKFVFSSDAAPGGHGRNVQELVAQVEEGGRNPMDVVVSATSLAANSLGMGDRIGTIGSGFEADIIAVGGDPLTDPGELDRVLFVMKGGDVYKNLPGPER